MNIPRIILILSILFICAMILAASVGCGANYHPPLTDNQKQWTAPDLEERLARAVSDEQHSREQK
ncbi:hypothetical protein EVB41_026 [Rhizobium phage RHph_TM3_14A]|nr:hypothetical protein EVB29_026 [Rhizobium phage RHph_TM27A]QIG66946.1 hypothetical protein EVB30_026 [Rhizobium phage RHph_TM27B]QIG67036.1 hypothetical protein EVB31_026 [Rhizobium phage RHph_TM29]QIG67491.1 hypothetical protein EVB41_026 [Rhizobium phage RHph_TM3_14A]